MAIGANSEGGNVLTGGIHRTQILDGISGPILADFDARRVAPPYGSLVDQQGHTWSLTRSATGRKLWIVDRDWILLGGDDYLSVARHPELDVPANGDLTLAVLLRAYGSAGGSNRTIVAYGQAPSGSGSGGYGIYWATSPATGMAGRISDGSFFPAVSLGSLPEGVTGVATLLRSVTADRLRGYINGVEGGSITDTTTGAIASTGAAFEIGRNTGGAHADAGFAAAVVFRRALSQAIIAARLPQLRQPRRLGTVPTTTAEPSPPMPPSPPPPEPEPTFGPLTLDWAVAYWAEGPKAQEQQWVADGPVSAVPDETEGGGHHLMTTPGSTLPVLREGGSEFLGKPRIESTVSGAVLYSANTFEPIEQPFTIVMVAAIGTVDSYLCDGDASSQRAAIGKKTLFVGGPPGGTPQDNWLLNAGTEIYGGYPTVTTAARLFIAEFLPAGDSLEVNGQLRASGDAGNHSIKGVVWGGHDRTQAIGKRAFYGLIPGQLTSQQKSDLRSWASTHYGIVMA